MADMWLGVPIRSNLSGSEQDTGVDLPANAMVVDVLVDVDVAEATGSVKTINVGILSSESGGDADGFIAGLSVATTGLKRPVAATATGSNETYLASTTRGALLQTFLAGSDTAGDVGTLVDKFHLTSSITGKSISITSPNAFSEFRGTLIFHLLRWDG